VKCSRGELMKVVLMNCLLEENAPSS
jgi:hypothetical protein